MVLVKLYDMQKVLEVPHADKGPQAKDRCSSNLW